MKRALDTGVSSWIWSLPGKIRGERTVVATVPPGAYTGIVRGANNGVGNAVVEAYNLQ